MNQVLYPYKKGVSIQSPPPYPHYKQLMFSDGFSVVCPQNIKTPLDPPTRILNESWEVHIQDPKPYPPPKSTWKLAEGAK